MYSEEVLKEIAEKFAIGGEVAAVKALGPGFINDTFVVSLKDSSRRFILQRKNHLVFPDVAGMMRNIELVTNHIRAKVVAEGGDPEREVLTVIRREPSSIEEREKNLQWNELYYKDGQGNFWAMCLFIEGSVTYEKADTPLLARMGGEGIGRFQAQLSDFTTTLNETIKGFHNIRWRFLQWDEALSRDAAGRVGECAEEISWIESRREKMLEFWSLVEKGEIPMRVSHNDTKISNILFDAQGRVLCVIDLDTCMSSTSLNDFGDAIRSYTNTGAEDEKDLSKVSMSIEMFKAYAEGYLSQRRASMSPMELKYLAFSACYITYEQVLRFLMDYLEGDSYYRTAYPGHNLVRARAQYALLQSMEEQLPQMEAVIEALK